MSLFCFGFWGCSPFALWNNPQSYRKIADTEERTSLSKPLRISCQHNVPSTLSSSVFLYTGHFLQNHNVISWSQKARGCITSLTFTPHSHFLVFPIMSFRTKRTQSRITRCISLSRLSSSSGFPCLHDLDPLEIFKTGYVVECPEMCSHCWRRELVLHEEI